MKLIILPLIFILAVSGDSSSEMLSQSDEQFLVFGLRANEENLVDLLNCTSDPLDRNCVQRKLFTEITYENLLKIIKVRAFIFLFLLILLPIQIKVLSFFFFIRAEFDAGLENFFD